MKKISLSVFTLLAVLSMTSLASIAYADQDQEQCKSCGCKGDDNKHGEQGGDGAQ